MLLVLQDALGGNCKTVVIAHVSPALACVEHTVATLGFATRAKMIINKVHAHTQHLAGCCEQPCFVVAQVPH